MSEDVKEKEELNEEQELAEVAEKKDEVKETQPSPETDEPPTPAIESAAAEENRPTIEEGGEEKEEPQPGNELVVKFTVEVKDEEIQKKFDEAAAEFANKAKLPGFRKGKIPIEVVKSRYKEALIEDVNQQVIEEAVRAKLQKEQLKIASTPVVEKVNYEPGKGLEALIRAEKLPEIQLPDLEQLEVEVPINEMFQKEYNEEESIKAFLESNKHRVPVTNRVIMENDYVKLIYQAKMLDTKRMSPKKEVEFLVNKEKENEFEIPGLADELTGKRIMDRLTVTRTYPADYKKKSWAGKDIEFTIEIDQIYELVKPELNDELLQALRIPDVDNFKKRLKEEYDSHIKQYRDDRDLTAIFEKLLEVETFPLPLGLVNEEMVNRIKETNTEITDEDHLKSLMMTYGPYAEKRVRMMLLFDALRENFKLEVTNEDIEKEFVLISEKTHVPVKEIRKYFMNSRQEYERTKQQIERTKICDFLRSKVKVKEVEKTNDITAEKENVKEKE